MIKKIEEMSKKGGIMNKERRKSIKEAICLIEQAAEMLEGIRDEEEEAMENLPDGIRYGEKGEQMQEYIDSINEAIESLEQADDILSDI